MLCWLLTPWLYDSCIQEVTVQATSSALDSVIVWNTQSDTTERRVVIGQFAASKYLPPPRALSPPTPSNKDEAERRK